MSGSAESRQKKMRLILEWNEGNVADLILQCRAAASAMKSGIEPNGLHGVGFENGSYFGVKRNKNSIRVYVNANSGDTGS